VEGDKAIQLPGCHHDRGVCLWSLAQHAAESLR
jgi:hypothetical protein